MTHGLCLHGAIARIQLLARRSDPIIGTVAQDALAGGDCDCQPDSLLVKITSTQLRMAKRRTTVRALAEEANIDVDEVLINLWDSGFSSVLGPNHTFDRGETSRARRALGLPTRRERASVEHWQDVFQLDAGEFPMLLQTLGLNRPFEGRKLTLKAQRRLATYAREHGVAAVAENVDRVAAEWVEVIEPLRWESIGREAEVRCLGVPQVAAIHDALVSDFAGGVDPIEPAGIKNPNLLASAVGRPHTAIGDTRKYPTIEMGAAALLHALVHNHPFHNGNKRTALVAMLVFLDANGLALTCKEDELFKLVLQLAQHALVSGPRQEQPDREVIALAQWLKANVRWIEKGDRQIQWRQLRRILVERGCECSEQTKGRVEVSRGVVRRGLLGRSKTVFLRSNVLSVGDRREIDRDALKKIRRELQLDEEHGIDSAAFYDDAATSPSEFIQSYRKTLRRLASL